MSFQNNKFFYLIIMLILTILSIPTLLYAIFFANKNPNIFLNTNNKIYTKKDFDVKISKLTDEQINFIYYDNNNREYSYLSNIHFKKEKNYVLSINYYYHDLLNENNFYLVKNKDEYIIYILNNKKFTLLNPVYLFFRSLFSGHLQLDNLEINFKNILKKEDKITIFYQDRILDTFILD